MKTFNLEVKREDFFNIIIKANSEKEAREKIDEIIYELNNSEELNQGMVTQSGNLNQLSNGMENNLLIPIIKTVDLTK